MDKTTMSRYGWTIVAVIIIAILLGLATPFAASIKANFIGVTNKLTNEAGSIWDVVDSVKAEHSGGGSGGSQGNSPGGESTLAYTISHPGSHTHDAPDIAENANYTVEGSVSDASKVKSITVNDASVTPRTDGSWSHAITLTKDEITEIVIVIADTSGNAATTTRYVLYDEMIAYALLLDNSASDTNKVPMVFVRSTDEINPNDTYNSSTYGELKVLHAYRDFEDGSKPWDKQRSTITSVIVEEVFVPAETASWFSGFTNCGYFDVSNINTSFVTNMSYMFTDAGRDVAITDFEIIGLDTWNTENVVNMHQLFSHAGYYSSTFRLDLSGWDTSSVTNMEGMFAQAGRNANTFELIGLKNWDVSSVTDMGEADPVDGGMFSYAGYKADKVELDLSGWDVSSVTNTTFMFRYIGYEADTVHINLSGWKLSPNLEWHDGADESMFSYIGFHAHHVGIDVSDWDTSHITDMRNLFAYVGQDATMLHITGLESWDTDLVTDMSRMFYRTGCNAESWEVDDLSAWDTSSVVDMSAMFYHTGKNSPEWTVGDLSRWNTSNVTDMSSMFESAGQNASTWSVGDISGWNTSNVTAMSSMFYNAGKAAPQFLDLSTWSVENVTTYYLFHDAARVIAPAWPNTCIVPNGTISIAGKAFASDTSLKVIIIPNSVTSVSVNAFNGCTSLTDVYFTGSEDEWNALLANVASGNTPLLNATIHYNYIAE